MYYQAVRYHSCVWNTRNTNVINLTTHELLCNCHACDVIRVVGSQACSQATECYFCDFWWPKRILSSALLRVRIIALSIVTYLVGSSFLPDGFILRIDNTGAGVV